MPNSIHALLDPGTWDADSQIKHNANPAGQDTNPNNGNEIPSVHRSGKSPRTFWKRIVAAWDRYWSRDLQTENRNGIEAYCQQLEAINLSMGTKARASLQSRITSGQAITLRKVKELALEEFCKQEFIDRFIMISDENLANLQNVSNGQQCSVRLDLLENAQNALTILKLHLGPAPADEDMARPRKEIQALDLINEKLEKIESIRSLLRARGSSEIPHTVANPFDSDHSSGHHDPSSTSTDDLPFLSLPRDSDSEDISATPMDDPPFLSLPRDSDSEDISATPMDDPPSFILSEKQDLTQNSVDAYEKGLNS